MSDFFSNSSFKFLSDLNHNNNKEWFIANKHIYQEELIDPLKKIIDGLGIFMHSIDNSLETKPVINKAISRIYRDTRYSKNKLPFKNYIGFNFRKKRPDWKLFPAFILRISPQGYYFGMSVMKNNPDHFYKFRKDIDNHKSFHKIISDLESDSDFDLWGEDYKKFLYQGDNKKMNRWYCKKNLFIKHNRDKNHYQSEKELVLDLQQNYEKMIPLYRYFNQVFDKGDDEI
jgi:uncharacterized protein (TIGR02453 family)